MELGGSRYAEQTIRTHVVSHLSSGQDSPLVRVDRRLYVLRGPTTSQSADPATSTRGMATEPEGAWPWEGIVQAVFASVLVTHGWELVSLANTATNAPGIDVLARKASEALVRR